MDIHQPSVSFTPDIKLSSFEKEVPPLNVRLEEILVLKI